MTKSKTKFGTIIALAIILYCGGAIAAEDTAGTMLHADRATLAVIKLQAQHGMMGAQFALGMLYRNGNGVPKDSVEAAKWMRKAAEQGYSPAQYDLAMMYRAGEGVPEDTSLSFKWLLAAVAENNPDADTLLGQVIASKSNTREEQIKAYRLFCLAAAQGDPRAEKAGRDLAQTMTRDAVEEGMNSARDQLTQTDKTGDQSLQFSKWYVAHTEIISSTTGYQSETREGK